MLKNIVVREVLADGIRISVVGGSQKIDADLLPDDLQKKYGLDNPAVAEAMKAKRAKEAESKALADAEKAKIESAEARTQQKLAAQQAETDKMEQLMKLPSPGRAGVFGEQPIRFKAEVVQVLDKNRAIVGGSKWLNQDFTKDGERVLGVAMTQNFLLIGISNVVDEQEITMVVYPCGRFTYTNVMGSTNTIYKYATTKELAYKTIMADPSRVVSVSPADMTPEARTKRKSELKDKISELRTKAFDLRQKKLSSSNPKALAEEALALNDQADALEKELEALNKFQDGRK
ncbi:MAG: hypothetical protein ACAI35_21650 [Candidatus Methylacidiphilales bacterium]|nr:hypothetical protein [Candidatus Methylacidiphilales bacterium]